MSYSDAQRQDVAWHTRLDKSGQAIADMLTEHFPWDSIFTGEFNPITRWLQEDPDGFVRQGEEQLGNLFNRDAVSRAATIFQMMVYDRENGPDGDGKSKSLRRHWYAWYKTKFAQPFALALGDTTVEGGITTMKNRDWEQRQSTTYSKLVDSQDVTYHDLWIKDASRRMEEQYEKLFSKFNVMLCVEKNSLFDDFLPPASAAGIPLLLSGAGKNGKAAMELALREHFRWPGYLEYDKWGYGTRVSPFSAENPLIILTVTDHDYDGEEVISNTFEAQARRYTDHVITARIGIEPGQLVATGGSLKDDSYTIKMNNSARQRWALKHAIFVTDCPVCGAEHTVIGDPDGMFCETCHATLEPADIKEDTAYGLEVEAIKTHDYYGLVATALLSVYPFSHIVQRLREECTADVWETANILTKDALEHDGPIAEFQAEIKALEAIQGDYESLVSDLIYEEAAPHVHDFVDEGDDPVQEEFIQYVASARGTPWPWRPFSRSDRTNSLVEWVRDNREELLDRIYNPYRGKVYRRYYDSSKGWTEATLDRFIIPDVPGIKNTGRCRMNGRTYDVRYTQADNWVVEEDEG